MIAFPPIIPDHHPGLGQGVELIPVESFATEPAVEAFYKAFPPRAARFDVQGPDPVLLEPSLDDGGDELRAVVTPQVGRGAMLPDGPLEAFQDVLGLSKESCRFMPRSLTAHTKWVVSNHGDDNNPGIARQPIFSLGCICGCKGPDASKVLAERCNKSFETRGFWRVRVVVVRKLGHIATMEDPIEYSSKRCHHVVLDVS